MLSLTSRQICEKKSRRHGPEASSSRIEQEGRPEAEVGQAQEVPQEEAFLEEGGAEAQEVPQEEALQEGRRRRVDLCTLGASG